jgi:hypothetical protein
LVETDPKETSPAICQHFYFDDDRRLPCLPGCRRSEGGGAKCLKVFHDPTCPYPKSRTPELPTLMPKPVRWCPGPGGCTHFDETTYSCALKLQARPFEFDYKYVNRDRKTWSFNFNGKHIMVIGAIYILCILYLKFKVGEQGWVTFVQFAFATFIITLGYLLNSWETRPWGSTRGTGDVPLDSKPSIDLDAVSAAEKTILDRGDCPVHYESVRGDLACVKSNCRWWNGNFQRCGLHDKRYHCEYPKSRLPIVQIWMTKEVDWCSGPGGCHHFDPKNYTCALKRANIPVEHVYIYESKPLLSPKVHGWFYTQVYRVADRISSLLNSKF